MIETDEGDFVFRGHNSIIFRIHMTDEGMIITSPQHRVVLVASTSEARNLRDWIVHQLDDTI
jgi:hypothetical protein